eukprot:2125987-Rhodomonas_salina.1
MLIVRMNRGLLFLGGYIITSAGTNCMMVVQRILLERCREIDLSGTFQATFGVTKSTFFFTCGVESEDPPISLRAIPGPLGKHHQPLTA